MKDMVLIPEIPEEDILDDLTFRIQKHRIKQNGIIWVFHKSDPDPFPSSPHGHRVDSNERLNPYTGEVYVEKQVKRRLKQKQLAFIQKDLLVHGFIAMDVIPNHFT